MTDHDINKMAKMQPRSDALENEASLRARQRFVVPPPKVVKPHSWVGLSKDRLLFSNDGTANQYKAQLCRLPDGQWRAIIRTLGSQPKHFATEEQAKTWVFQEVYRLRRENFNFYGPDKAVPESHGCDA